MARRLAQGLKTHKRKGASTSGSTKRARTEGTSSAMPAQVAIAVDAPSDVEPEVPRASSRSPLIEVFAPKAHPEGPPGGQKEEEEEDPGP